MGTIFSFFLGCSFFRAACPLPRRTDRPMAARARCIAPGPGSLASPVVVQSRPSPAGTAASSNLRGVGGGVATGPFPAASGGGLGNAPAVIASAVGGGGSANGMPIGPGAAAVPSLAGEASLAPGLFFRRLTAGTGAGGRPALLALRQSVASEGALLAGLMDTDPFHLADTLHLGRTTALPAATAAAIDTAASVTGAVAAAVGKGRAVSAAGSSAGIVDALAGSPGQGEPFSKPATQGGVSTSSKRTPGPSPAAYAPTPVASHVDATRPAVTVPVGDSGPAKGERCTMHITLCRALSFNVFCARVHALCTGRCSCLAHGPLH
jgi:hypothetical protein